MFFSALESSASTESLCGASSESSSRFFVVVGVTFVVVDVTTGACGTGARRTVVGAGRGLRRVVVGATVAGSTGAATGAGVVVVDPQTTWVDVTVTVGNDAVLEPGTQLKGTTSVASGAVVGPDTTLVDCTVEAGASVVRSHCLGAVVGPEATAASAEAIQSNDNISWTARPLLHQSRGAAAQSRFPADCGPRVEVGCRTEKSRSSWSARARPAWR